LNNSIHIPSQSGLIKTLNYFRYSRLSLIFKKDIAFLIIFVAIFGGLLTPVDFAFATPEEGGDTGSSGDQPDPEPGLIGDPDPEPPTDPCEENPEAEGCVPEPPADPCIEDPTAEGCEPVPPRLLGPSPQPMPPYEGCLLDPTLPECTPPPGAECPQGYLMNEDGQCYPDKPCPPGYERIDDDESGACHPIPEENIYIDIIIVTEINNQIKKVSTPTTCTPQESTITLGPGSIAAKGVRVLAAFDPCVLSGGGAMLNLPDSNNNLKLLAVDLEGGNTHKAVEVNLQKINTITDDQTFYNADFTRSMTGMSPITNKVDTVQDINSLVLLNDSPGHIQFVNDNSMAFNAVLSPN
jgi:hypothetical protein